MKANFMAISEKNFPYYLHVIMLFFSYRYTSLLPPRRKTRKFSLIDLALAVAIYHTASSDGVDRGLANAQYTL